MSNYDTVTNWEGRTPYAHYIERHVLKYPRDLPTLCGKRGGWHVTLTNYPVCQVCYVLKMMVE